MLRYTSPCPKLPLLRRNAKQIVELTMSHFSRGSWWPALSLTKAKPMIFVMQAVLGTHHSKKNGPFDPADKWKQSALENSLPLRWLHFDFPTPDCGKLLYYDGDQQPSPKSWDCFLPFLQLVYVFELFRSFCYTLHSRGFSDASHFESLSINVLRIVRILSNMYYTYCVHTCMFLLFFVLHASAASSGKEYQSFPRKGMKMIECIATCM